MGGRRKLISSIGKIDAVLTKRIEDMRETIALMDRKQSDLRKIEEALDYSSTLVKSISDERKIRLERKENLWDFDKENCKLKEDCNNLKSGYMVLFCNHSRSNANRHYRMSD
uniref:Uncharacterized protein n=1 Tax=Wuchereria bancrofti TaxID=6293 RepID=A0A1I8EPE8_WUCBA